jgi:predicted TIM-barrel fold metal-dependent hydrolase
MIIDYSVNPPFKEFLMELDYIKDYLELYRDRAKESGGETVEWSTAQYIELLDREGIDIAIIKARDVETTLGKGKKITNEACAAHVRKYPKRLIGMAGVDPFKGKAAVEELEYAIKDLGLKGVNFWPYEYNIYAHDKAYYPIYEKCQQLGAVVSIETSIHFRRDVRMDLCHPRYLDYVAVDFPELKLVGSTPGWPWVSELMGVAWRHPNVHVCIGYVRPKYFANPRSGYESLIQLGGSILQNKIIFGSGWPNLPMKRGVEEVRALPIKDEVKEKWLYHNAAKLFGVT